MNLSTGDKIRVALAPLHLGVGASILWSAVKTGTPMLFVMGVLFCAFGAYRIALVARALRGKK
jgi:hypothetical protein